MILTPHAIVGAALANIVPYDPALGLGLAFFSHYALDMLPHTDYDVSGFVDTKTKTVKSVFKETKTAIHLLLIVADFAIAIFLCIFIFVRNRQSLFLTLIGIVGGLLPDFFQFLYYKYNSQPWIFYQKIHNRLHALIKIKNEKFWGIFLQIIIPISFILIYFYISHRWI